MSFFPLSFVKFLLHVFFEAPAHLWFSVFLMNWPSYHRYVSVCLWKDLCLEVWNHLHLKIKAYEIQRGKGTFPCTSLSMLEGAGHFSHCAPKVSLLLAALRPGGLKSPILIPFWVPAFCFHDCQVAELCPRRLCGPPGAPEVSLHWSRASGLQPAELS